MTEPLPAPLVPGNVELKDFPYFPLYAGRLRDSDFVASASAEAFRAGILLLCAAWHQVPAATLPDDDRLLAKLAGYGFSAKEFAKVRNEALHGWIKCADGRFHHPLLAEAALHCWREKLRKRHKQACDRVRQSNKAREENNLPPLEMPPQPAELAANEAEPRRELAASSAGIPCEPAANSRDPPAELAAGSARPPAELAAPSAGFPAEGAADETGPPCEPAASSAGIPQEATPCSAGIRVENGLKGKEKVKKSSSSLRAEPARDDDDLLRRLKKAALGRVERGCTNVEPIRKLIAEGFDLEGQILPCIADKVPRLKRPLRTWGGFLPDEIRAWAREGRADEARGAAGEAAPPTVWVAHDTPDFERCVVARKHLENKAKPPLDNRGGWTFPRHYLDFDPAKLAPPEAAE